VSKKVLIFTYYWPPAGGVAVQRWLKFSKYLPEFGWEPIIVTVDNGSYPYNDESLLNEVSPSLRVYRTKTFEPFELYNLLKGKRGKNVPTQTVSNSKSKSLFQKLSEYIRANYFIPDARKGWLRYAVKQAEEIIRNEKIDVIITSGPPHSTQLIGLDLKKKFDVKWLADFRDPWTEIFYNKYLPRTKATIDKDYQLETDVLQNADAVITIGNGIKKMFEARSTKTKVLFNGFDRQDLPVINDPIRNEKFIVGHIGTYISSLNSEGLWKAMQELIKEEEDFKDNCCFRFTGRVDASIIAKMKSYDVLQLAEFSDFVSHKEAVKRMHDSDLLLIVFANVPDNKYIVSGRLFEYLASGTPILAIGPIDGDANSILTETSRDSILDYDDSASIKNRILKHYSNWKQNNKVSKKLETEGVDKYERKEITRQLSVFLNQVIEKST
jgi:glycosyltransferase involved in cell wall biosynthesis